MNFFKQPPVVRGDYANHYIYGHWLFMAGFGITYALAGILYDGLPVTNVFPVAIGAGFVTAVIFAALREATRPQPSWKDLMITIGGACEAAFLIFVGTIVVK